LRHLPGGFGARARRPLDSFPTRRSSDLHLRGDSIEAKPDYRVAVEAADDDVAMEQVLLIPIVHQLREVRECQPLQLQPRQQALRSEEHTSELQSLAYLVCRLLLEKKKRT